MAIPERTALDWRQEAACARPGVDLDWFFPEPGEHGKAKRAKRVCSTCPVQAPCLEDALAAPWVDGIRAGTSLKDRGRLRAVARGGAA